MNTKLLKAAFIVALFSIFSGFAMEPAVEPIEESHPVELKITNKTSKNYHLQVGGVPKERLKPGAVVVAKTYLKHIKTLWDDPRYYLQFYFAKVVIIDPENENTFPVNLEASVGGIGSSVAIFTAKIAQRTPHGVHSLLYDEEIKIPQEEYNKATFAVSITLKEKDGQLDPVIDAVAVTK